MSLGALREPGPAGQRGSRRLCRRHVIVGQVVCVGLGWVMKRDGYGKGVVRGAVGVVMGGLCCSRVCCFFARELR